MQRIMRILESEGIIFLLFLGLFPPKYLQQVAVTNKVINVLQLIACLVIPLLYFSDIRIHIKKLFNQILILLWMELLISTLLSDGASFNQYINNAAHILIACFLWEELVIRNPYGGLKCLYVYFAICTLINTITIFVFPDAMYPNNRGVWVCWFLGEDNGGYIYYVMASMTAMLYCHYIKKRITLGSVLTWISTFTFVIHNNIATGIVCQIIWLFLIIGIRFSWFRKLLRAEYAFYILIAGFFLIVIGRTPLLQPIVAIFHRNPNMGRAAIWDRTLTRINESPLLGLGIYTAADFDSVILNKGWTNAHSQLLMYAFYGGILGTILLCSLFYIACCDGRKCINSVFYQDAAIGLIVMSVRYIAETTTGPMYYLFLVVMVYGKEFLQNISSKTELQRGSRIKVKGIPRIRMLPRKESIV